jgi:hypothetical protein
MNSNISTEYLSKLVEIGLEQQKKGNFDEAEQTWLEYASINPDDYFTYIQLIQIQYKRNEYKKAEPFILKVYDGYKKGLVDDIFCIDYFSWNSWCIEAYHRCEDGDKENDYSKLLFFVYDQNQNLKFEIRMDYSPFYASFAGWPKYLFCKIDNDKKLYYNGGLNDGYDYEDIKLKVQDILDEKIKPGATFILNDNLKQINNENNC